MRNKRAIKYTMIPLVDLFISGVISFVITFGLIQIMLFLWRTTTYRIINIIVDIGYRLPFLVPAFIIMLIVTIFSWLTYKRSIPLADKIIEGERLKNINNQVLDMLQATNEMVNGDLDKTISEEYDGEVGELSRNINNIVLNLKNITVEEKRAQATKNDLITNVSHDLRTPLTSIMGYLSLIERDEYRDEVQLRYYTNIAYEKSKSLNLLINDLFELTKMQNSGVKLERTSIDLVELLSQIISQFQYEFSMADMVSRLRFSNEKLIINGDGNKLVRAFENLITNAIKYGREGIYVDVFTIREENNAIVEIVNYGEEISQSDLEFIFDRFYRIEKSRNREEGGTGLGLSITKSIIELHNGEIFALSEEGRTVFRIILPLEN
ncbi:MAG: sensor histidine kinase [Clostridium sp.]